MIDEPQVHVWELPGDNRARGMARLLVDGVVGPDEPDVRDAVGRLAAQIVDDATTPGGDGCVLTIEVRSSHVTVTVAGPGARLVPGLAMLDVLAQGWGVQASRSGRAVWFEVARRQVAAGGTVPS